MQKRIIPVLLIGLMFAATTQINAQKKSFERKVNKQVEKKESIETRASNQSRLFNKLLYKRIPLPATKVKTENESAGNSQLFNKLPYKSTSIPVSKIKADDKSADKYKAQLFSKLPYKKR